MFSICQKLKQLPFTETYQDARLATIRFYFNPIPSTMFCLQTIYQICPQNREEKKLTNIYSVQIIVDNIFYIELKIVF
jgi:hypothetical protein